MFLTLELAVFGRGRSRVYGASRDDRQRVGERIPRVTSRLIRAHRMPGGPTPARD